MWRILLITLVLVTGVFLMPVQSAYAQNVTSANVTIYATGYVIAAPGNFTMYYVSDFELGLSWEKKPGANNTMVRCAVGRAPENRTDGELAYYGNGTNASYWTNVGYAGPVYCTAWHENESGWGTYAEEDGNFMSMSFLFLGMILMAGFLTFFSLKRPEMLIRLAASFMWLAMCFWILLGSNTNLDLDDPWTILIGAVFVIMAFVPLVFQMTTEVRREGKGTSWSSFVKRGDEEAKETEYERHKRLLQGKRRKK